jgi:hypothetical protein
LTHHDIWLLLLLLHSCRIRPPRFAVVVICERGSIRSAQRAETKGRIVTQGVDQQLAADEVDVVS